MTTKYCRWCRAGYHDVQFNDFFVDAGRAHFITGSAGLMTGDRKQEPVKKKPVVDPDDESTPAELEAISSDEFFGTDPEQLPETLPGIPESAAEGTANGLV